MLTKPSPDAIKMLKSIEEYFNLLLSDKNRDLIKSVG